MNILIVDDDKTNLMLATAMLKKLGYASVSVNSGEEALALYDENPVFDVIFMDINMPGLDGYAATLKLREKGCKAKIVAVSANTYAEVSIKSKQAGMDDYLIKPLELNKIATLLEAVG